MVEELMTFKEAQEYLGISKAKMGRLAKTGSLPVYSDPLDKRKKLVPRAEVEKLKQPRATKGAPPLARAPAPPAAAEVKKPETKAEVKSVVEPEGPFAKLFLRCNCVECGWRGEAEFEPHPTSIDPDLGKAKCPNCGRDIFRKLPSKPHTS